MNYQNRVIRARCAGGRGYGDGCGTGYGSGSLHENVISGRGLVYHLFGASGKGVVNYNKYNPFTPVEIVIKECHE